MVFKASYTYHNHERVFVGKVTRKVSKDLLIWMYFKRHPYLVFADGFIITVDKIKEIKLYPNEDCATTFELTPDGHVLINGNDANNLW